MKNDVLERALRLKPPGSSAAPSLHLNVRTRQQRVVGGLAVPLSFEAQEKGVMDLHALFSEHGARTTLMTAVDDDGQVIQQPQKSTRSGGGGGGGSRLDRTNKKKRRRTADGVASGVSSSSASGGSGGVSLESSYDQQPGVSIRNFACIEAMRTFLHRTTLQVQKGN